MKLLESGEMYLETILVLSEKIEKVRAIDICEYMGFSKPSVSRALGLLKSGGYVVADDDGYLSLTGLGAEVAHKMYDRHRLITKFLTSLGVPENIATSDACKIEHCISDESFEAITKSIKSDK